METHLDFLNPAENDWQTFWSSHEDANIFHHPMWMQLLEASYGYRPFVAAVRNADGNIIAGLPVMEVGGLLIRRRWISLPFTDHCRPLYCSEEALRCLTNTLVRLSSEKKSPQMEIRSKLPPHPNIQSNSHQVLHTLPLRQNVDSVTSEFHSSHRRNTLIALKKGVRIEMGQKMEHIAIFYQLHLQTRRRQGIPIQPWTFFNLLGSMLIEKGLGFVLLAYKDKECLAAAVFLHWQHTLTYKYGASTLAGLNFRPNNLLFSTAIRWGCEEGYTVFDMGKTESANTGLCAFKRGWGAEETPLYYSNMLIDSPRTDTSRLMTIMQAVIRHSPAWVCRIAGNLLYKYFGT